jgi:hypothetical protein
VNGPGSELNINEFVFGNYGGAPQCARNLISIEDGAIMPTASFRIRGAGNIVRVKGAQNGRLATINTQNWAFQLVDSTDGVLDLCEGGFVTTGTSGAGVVVGVNPGDTGNRLRLAGGTLSCVNLTINPGNALEVALGGNTILPALVSQTVTFVDGGKVKPNHEDPQKQGRWPIARAANIVYTGPLAGLLSTPSGKYVYDLWIEEEPGAKVLWFSCFRPGTLLMLK